MKLEYDKGLRRWTFGFRLFRTREDAFDFYRANPGHAKREGWVFSIGIVY